MVTALTLLYLFILFFPPISFSTIEKNRGKGEEKRKKERKGGKGGGRLFVVVDTED